MLAVLDDLRAADVDFVTIGQYLPPTLRHAAVARWVAAGGVRRASREAALARGFLLAAASPLTRSSYHADQDFERLRAAREAQPSPERGGEPMVDRDADVDPQETREWLEALDSVLGPRGTGARPLPDRAADRPGAPLGREPALLRDHRLRQHDPRAARSRRCRASPGSSTASARWCAGTRSRWWCRRIARARSSADTSRASPPRRRSTTSASTTSSARPHDGHGGDLVYIQGHSSPGIYARAFLEGRLDEEQLRNFRQEVDGRGLSSYPHPWLMPEFWQFPTVSMGLGPIMGIYQARFMRYLHHRGLIDARRSQGLGVHGRRRDGRARVARRDRARRAREARQPDLRGELQPAAPRRPRARQRQDHPGARGHLPRRRLERDQGDLGRPLGCRCSPRTARACSSSAWNEAVDGDYQNYKVRGGAYTREHFFGDAPGAARDGRAT